jgi:hypothetical protein
MTPKLPNRTALAAALALAIAAGLAVGGPAHAQDLRSPDAKDAAVQTQGDQYGLRSDAPTSSLAGTTSPKPADDLRSADARDAVRIDGAPAGQDLRSPDARDGVWIEPGDPTAAPVVADDSPGTFKWGDAAIGAAAMLGLLLLLAGGAALMSRRQRAATA